MGVLDRFERRLDRMVNGAFAKTFKSDVEPVEVAAALQRECDDRAVIVDRERRVVPNRFEVQLGAHDFERLAPYAVPLGAEFAAMVRDHAAQQGYTFFGPVAVTLTQVDELDTGVFQVRSEADAPLAPAPPPPPTPTGGTTVIPRSRAPRAWLEVGGAQHPLDHERQLIGRADDCDLQIEDLNMSRHHAELVLEQAAGRLVLRDLGSTNGTWVNGKQVTQAELRDGQRFTLGTTEFVVRLAS